MEWDGPTLEINHPTSEWLPYRAEPLTAVRDSAGLPDKEKDDFTMGPITP